MSAPTFSEIFGDERAGFDEPREPAGKPQPKPAITRRLSLDERLVIAMEKIAKNTEGIWAQLEDIATGSHMEDALDRLSKAVDGINTFDACVSVDGDIGISGRVDISNALDADGYRRPLGVMRVAD